MNLKKTRRRNNCSDFLSNFSVKNNEFEKNNCSDWKNVCHINELKMDFTVRLMDRYINICKDLRTKYLQNCLKYKTI